MSKSSFDAVEISLSRTEFTFLPNPFFAGVPLPQEAVLCVTAEVWLTQRLLCVHLSRARHFVLRPPTWQALVLVPCNRWKGGVEFVASA